MKKLTKIEGDFIWYKKKWKDIDVSKIKSIGGFAYLQGYSGDLNSLKSIGGYADLHGYSGDLSSLESIGSFADLQGYSGDLSSLKSIGGSAYLQDYSGDLSSMSDDFNKVYIEYEDNAITMKEYRIRRGIIKNDKMITLSNGKQKTNIEKLRKVRIR